MAQHRINRDDIKVSQPLPWDAFNAEGLLLLKQGQIIFSFSQVERLLETGLYIEAGAGGDAQTAPRPITQAERPTVVSMLLQARRKLERACIDLFEHRGADFHASILQLRHVVREACAQNDAVALALMLMDDSGRYSTRHMVDAATVCEVMGQSMGMNDAELESIVAGALTMNVAMMVLQDRLQQQTFPLNDEQRELIRIHPGEGARMLKEVGVMDPLWLRAVAEHHEALDGGGYPEQRKGDEICLGARLVALADAYCARVSAHAYRPAALSSIALRDIFTTQKEKEARELANQLIKVMGIFPPGSCVELQNGEIGVVIRKGEKANTPQVAALIGPRSEPYAHPLIRETFHACFAVRRAMPRVKLVAGIKLSTLWGKDAIY